MARKLCSTQMVVNFLTETLVSNSMTIVLYSVKCRVWMTMAEFLGVGLGVVVALRRWLSLVWRVREAEPLLSFGASGLELLKET